MLLDHAGLVVEPSAALGIAAILETVTASLGRNVVTIVCGSNVDLDAPTTAGSARTLMQILTMLDSRDRRRLVGTGGDGHVAAA